MDVENSKDLCIIDVYALKQGFLKRDANAAQDIVI